MTPISRALQPIRGHKGPTLARGRQVSACAWWRRPAAPVRSSAGRGVRSYRPRRPWTRRRIRYLSPGRPPTEATTRLWFLGAWRSAACHRRSLPRSTAELKRWSVQGSRLPQIACGRSRWRLLQSRHPGLHGSTHCGYCVHGSHLLPMGWGAPTLHSATPGRSRQRACPPEP